jgi:predicted phosphodiesterase
MSSGASPRPIRFATISDLHIARPETVWDHPSRFHLVEVSIPALEQILERLATLDLDFLLLPGDLTQHGEPENHAWLVQRLQQLPYPVYVVPGNHDVPASTQSGRAITLAEFVEIYRDFGYAQDDSHGCRPDPHRPIPHPYYTCEILPGLRLIALNSNQRSPNGRDIVGSIDAPQLAWLDRVLAQLRDEWVMVMVHHNAIAHLPGQADHPLGQRYLLDNAPTLQAKLQAAGVQLIFTGHLHIQDIAEDRGLYDITTGSLVSYPHPYRVLTLRPDAHGQWWIEVESGRVESVPGWEQLPQVSRQWMSDRSPPFMTRLLTDAPLDLADAEIATYTPHLRTFWADIAQGDTLFHFPALPPKVRHYCEQFGAIAPDGTPHLIDNHVALRLQHPAPPALLRWRDRETADLPNACLSASSRLSASSP